MLTIEGLTMAGLGPPEAAPAAQGGAPQADFAALLAAASGAPLAGTPGGFAAPSAAGAVLDRLPLPTTPTTPAVPVEAGPASEATFTLLDLLTLPEPPASAAGDSPLADTPRPDRTSEATVSEDDSQTVELLAAALAGSISQVSPQAVTPLVSMRATMDLGTLGAVPGDGETLASEGGMPPRVVAMASGDWPALAADTAASRAALAQALPPTPASASAPTALDVASAGTSLVGGPLDDPVVEPAARSTTASLESVTSEDVPARMLPAAVNDVPREDSAPDSSPRLASGDRDGLLVSELGQAASARHDQQSASSSSLTTVDPGGPVLPASAPSPNAAAPTPAPEVARTDLGAPTTERLEEGPAAASAVIDSPRGASESPEATEAAGTTQATTVVSNDSTPVADVAAVGIGSRSIDSTAGAAPAPPAVDATDQSALQARLADSVLAAARTDSSVRLVLNPPDLGHVEIRVERHEQGLRVELVTATADAADLIKQQLPTLVSGLEARAVRVDQADVRLAPPSGSSAFSLGSDARQAGSDASGSGRQWERPDWSEAARDQQESARPQSGGPRSGLIDLVA